MRLWSLHPRFLDTKGLVAVWREGLLAQKVLMGQTKGYKNHPQLKRFYQTLYPPMYIGIYLHHIWEEAQNRKHNFDISKIKYPKQEKYLAKHWIPVTIGQLLYEYEHLQKKLKERDFRKYGYNTWLIINPNPLFRTVKGNIEPWEKVK